MKISALIKKELIIWLMILAPFVFAFISWDKLPESIPVHWNIDGIPNRFENKGLGIFVEPLISVGLYFILLALPKIDPKKANYAQFETVFRAIRLVIHSLLSVIFIIGLLSAMHYPINTTYITMLLIPFMFMILGNFMGKIRPNYFVGIRTPWTLASEEVWVKTHRVTGRVWVAASFLYLLLNLFTKLPHLVEIVYIALLIVVPFVYSFVKYKQISPES